MSKLFLPQALLEEWASTDKVDLGDGRLLVASDKTSYAVTPAVHFLKVVSGEDEKKLVSKVKTQAQADALGVEQVSDSAIVGETAYEIASGYVCEVPLPSKAGEKKVSAEADLLAKFLLDKL